MPGLLLDPAALPARAALAADERRLAPLARSLAADLDRVLAADAHVAERKARLTRAGGRCPAHGTEFAFDPFGPDRFRCDACRRDYAGGAHHEFWLYRYQLWLAERAVHAAALHAVLGRPDHAAFAARVLAEAADAYARLPNRDNVLGPSRPFFSTYLESLWLLSLAAALDLLEARGGAGASLGADVRDRLLAPSRALIASYPEGRSNRQVWNAAARLAASRLLGDARGAEEAVHGRDGIAAVLSDGLLADGTWYEGDNYHQFAHRGLWYGVTMAERAGLPVAPALTARFARGWAAPFLVAMPGATLPARGDAQFGVSLRQWRWAEWLELALAGPPVPVSPHPGADGGPGFLARWLRLLYTSDQPADPERGRWRTSGEAERNEPAAALSRADLGWKSLLFARAEMPTADLGAREADTWPGSVLLPEQGLAVLRDTGRPEVYASLDYGRPAGGHGHPDRLSVQVHPHLLDPGTGAYVDRTLHWYRSTLAHGAPVVAERSQPPALGRLLGFDAAVGAGFQAVGAEAPVAPGVVARRWLVLGRGYLLDHLAWSGLSDRVLDLPLGGEPWDVSSPDPDAPGAARVELATRPATRPGAGGLEDGFDFLDNVEETAEMPTRITLQVGARGFGADYAGRVFLHVYAAAGVRLWRAYAPGAPGHEEDAFCAARVAGDSGTLWVLWDHNEHMPPAALLPDGSLALTVARGVTHRHTPPGPDGRGPWRVHVNEDGAPPRDVALAVGDHGPGSPARRVAPDDRLGAPDVVPSPPAGPVGELAPGAAPLTFALGEPHYRRTEAAWDEAGRPTAEVSLRIREDALHVDVAVQLGRPPRFVPPGAENPLDNERAGVNSDGLQLHLGLAVAGGRVEPAGAWLMVPLAPGPAVDVTRTSAPDATAPGAAPLATWRPRPDGWTIAVVLPLAPLRARAGAAAPVLAVDVLVNERPPERERRRGQLVLGGLASPAERAYLVGDRHDPGRGIRVQLPAPPSA